MAVGALALSGDTLGSRSTAVGRGALKVQNFTTATETHNTAVGYSAGESITTGTANTLIGNNTGQTFTDGIQNTALGYAALGSASQGASYNQCFGTVAGNSITSGNNNMAIGYGALLTGRPGGNVTTGSNIIGIGNADHTAAHIQISLTIASDSRDKTDFTPLDLGLDFVKSLSPFTYKWDKRSKYGDNTAADYDLSAQTPDGTHKEDWLDIGFKAQEVEALEIAAGYNKDNKTNLVSSCSEDGKQMGLQYEKFVPILVKAIQDQDAIITALTARVAALES